MFLTGFADEAGKDFDIQLKAARELGWKYIETRAIGEKNLSTLTDAEFDEICCKLTEADISFNCYGSTIANWAMSATSDEDFDNCKKLLCAAIPRMHTLGIKMLRGMSFARAKDQAPDSPELEKIIFGKLNELVKICEDNGIVYGHENCMNYGGLSHLHTLKLLENIKSPAFTLIFDTGNPVFNYRRIGTAPYPLQSAWEFYKNVREFITHVHIKDGTALPQENCDENPDCEYCFAGDGCADVRAIIKDLLKSGYDGGFAIEPHIAAVFHEKDSAANADKAYSSYIEYGRRFEKLLNEIRADI